jgi:hypothetical protein
MKCKRKKMTKEQMFNYYFGVFCHAVMIIGFFQGSIISAIYFKNVDIYVFSLIANIVGLVYFIFKYIDFLKVPNGKSK